MKSVFAFILLLSTVFLVEACKIKPDCFFDDPPKIEKSQCLKEENLQFGRKPCLLPNEIYQICGSCEKTCANPNPVCPRICHTGCFCKEGYLRDEETGLCVVPAECTQEPPGVCYLPNEVYQTCGPCEKTCANPNPICGFKCHIGCFCKKGYLRDEKTGLCVVPSKCTQEPPGVCLLPNEVYQTCGSCEKTCANPNPACPRICHIGCFCKEGFLRDEITGFCVAPKHCPPTIPRCNGPNEEYSECKGCDLTCKHQDAVPCPLICIPGCRCKSGFVRDEETGFCVSPWECQSNRRCNGPNEEYSDCKGCDPTCKHPEGVICPAICTPGCRCKPGFLRDEETGFCVSPWECQSNRRCNDPNEEYSDCKGCDPTCEHPEGVPCPRICIPGCRCKLGFLRDEETGFCVSPWECQSNRRCNGPNEEYSDCKGCDPTCEHPEGVPCPYICIPGCRCKPGYLRDEETGFCVSPWECQSNRRCNGPNEEYSECKGCDLTCEHPEGVPCPRICIPGCRCKLGFLRDEETGFCVSPWECQSNRRCNDPNEEYSDCKGCDPTCEHPEGVPCPYICIPGCRCKPGYLRDEETGFCVSPWECQSNRPQKINKNNKKGLVKPLKKKGVACVCA